MIRVHSVKAWPLENDTRTAIPTRIRRDSSFVFSSADSYPRRGPRERLTALTVANNINGIWRHFRFLRHTGAPRKRINRDMTMGKNSPVVEGLKRMEGISLRYTLSPSWTNFYFSLASPENVLYVAREYVFCFLFKLTLSISTGASPILQFALSCTRCLINRGNSFNVMSLGHLILPTFDINHVRTTF